MITTVFFALAALTAAYWISLLVRARLLPPPLPDIPPADPDPSLALPALPALSERQRVEGSERQRVEGSERQRVEWVSILVAVRNEMDRTLLESIESFIAQDAPAIDVIAIDDHSEDESRAALAALGARHARLRVIEAARSAHGKRAALVSGAAAARGTWLLFTDADARLTPDAVRRGVGYAMRHGVDALSLLPRTLVVSLPEQIALAAVSWLVYEGTHLRRCNRDDAPVGLAAAGPYLLVSRAAFDAIGGYAAIRHNVLIDVALARRLREHGFRYRYLRSDGCVETRMYRSLGEIWRGFGKNAYVALGDGAGVKIAGVAAAVLLMMLPAIAVAAGLARGDAILLAIGIVAAIAMAHVQHRGAVFMGARVRPLALLLAPLGALLWLAIVLHSAWWTRARATVRWKGRALPVFDPRVDG